VNANRAVPCVVIGLLETWEVFDDMLLQLHKLQG